MITVATPPPLPVRDKATAGDRTAGALSPMLGRLAEERATGVLVREHGTLYLARGRVVHAESPHAPGLDVLLTAHGTLAATAWQRAARRASDVPGTVRLLLDAGLLPAGALELCHLDALYDAGFFALAPSGVPGRFHYDGVPDPGPLPPVPVVALERETLRRRLLLHRLWPDPATDSAPLVRADPAAPVPVPPRRRAVLDRVDGVRTAPEIARDLGRQAFHTLVDVRRLAAAGLLAPVPAASGPPPPAVPAPPLTVTDPDVTLLKRLRDALEAL
ncbi:transcriptional regulator [Streptomyces sp. TG1A-8]|uniref:transcriptional regulator n=1 Tax=Streptomyces sp. TG1A-8 TaxID=3051385 RepID=UPI00265BB0B8|nr:transcriptional regulator [Streptomyces sp. TG1A-8]MDO0927376.1 transcriptional regulator [Streptomyces sp. TG1A-8]